MIKKVIKIIGAFLAIVLLVGGIVGAIFYSKLTKIEPNTSAGFYSPYYLFDPGNLDASKEVFILVMPNNTGRPDDDPWIHERKVLTRILGDQSYAKDLNVLLLVPVFPRVMSNWRVYTHALDRDVFLTSDQVLGGLDKQLVAMIDDARNKYREKGIQVSEKVLMAGFSASAMFTNRFTILHPDRVQATAIGSPGGWPVLPVQEWKGDSLFYPVGIADLDTLAGVSFKTELFNEVEQYFYLGDQDENDAVQYGDGYDDRERELVYTHFGKNMVERWEIAEQVYDSVGSKAQFKLYPNIGHDRTADMNKDIKAFFKKAMENH